MRTKLFSVKHRNRGIFYIEKQCDAFFVYRTVFLVKAKMLREEVEFF